ncbi:MAG: SpoIIE family protein phosphatase [Pseudomonadota bacterium]
MRWLWSGEEARSGQICRLTVLALTLVLLAVHIWADRRGDIPLRNFWWDTLHGQMPRDRGDAADAPAVVVAIDEETMSLYGEWPWPRSETAAVISQAYSLGATVVASDVIFSQSDPRSPRQLADYFRARGIDGPVAELEKLGHTDDYLKNVLKQANVVLPVIGSHVLGPEDTKQCDFLDPSVLIQPPELAEGLSLRFEDSDPPLPEFQGPARGLATIDFVTDNTFVIRSLNAVQTICDKPILLLGPEAIWAARPDNLFSHVGPTWTGLQVTLGEDGDVPAPRFPAESDGKFWMHFGKVDADRYIAAKDLFEPDFDRSRFEGKIAFLAVIDLGRVDQRKSPLGEVIYGIEAHLQMIEQIFAQDFLRRPAFLIWLEIAVFLVAAGAIAVFAPGAAPIKTVVAIAAGMTLWLGLGAGLFATGVLVDAISPAGGVLVVSLGALAATLVERDRQRLRSLIDLERVRADRAQLQGELDAAARIQMALLPPRHFAIDGQIDLACYIDPARTVGGDFYDHFMVDEKHLFFLVADVSDKGADASQFMLVSKTLWKSVALRTEAPLDVIQLKANSEITRENTALMFVTGLCGLLNLETRVLTYSSAGHDTPYVFGDGRLPEQLVLGDTSPPAGLMDGIEFPVGTVQLSPGDRLCIFTDGVTEAMDASNELFGSERLEATLGTAATGLDSQAVVEHVVSRVRRFTQGAEQSDDLTLMVVSIPEQGRRARPGHGAPHRNPLR